MGTEVLLSFLKELSTTDVRNVKSLLFFFNLTFKLYITVLVLPNIKMNLPQVYMCSPS